MGIFSFLPPCFHVAVSPATDVLLHDSAPVGQPLLRPQPLLGSFNTVSSSNSFSSRGGNALPRLGLWMPHHALYASSVLLTPLLLVPSLASLHLNHLGRILFTDGTLTYIKFYNFIFGFDSFVASQL